MKHKLYNPAYQREYRIFLLLGSILIFLAFVIPLPILLTKGINNSQLTIPSAGFPTIFPNVSLYGGQSTSVLYPVIAAAQAGSVTLFVTIDYSKSSLWWRTWKESRWTIDWREMKDNKGSSIRSCATFATGDDSVQLVTTYVDNSARARSYLRGKWYSTTFFSNFPRPAYGTPSVCSSAPGAGDLIVVGKDHTPYHKRYFNETAWTSSTGYNKYSDNIRGWESSKGWMASNVAISCTNDRMDMVSYGDYQPPNRLFYKNWVNSTKFSYWTDLGGDYIGDPAIVSRGDQLDMFGLWRQNASYNHVSGPFKNYTVYGDHGDPVINLGGQYHTDLGGHFQSSPQVISLAHERIDLLAIGAVDRQLWHRCMINNTWSPSWTNLGGIFASAPTILSPKPGIVMVLGVSEDNAIFWGNWSVDFNAFEWSDGPRWLTDNTAKLAATIDRGNLIT